MAYRTVLHGTCLLNGKHPPGFKEAKECPVLNRTRRSERAQRAARTRARKRLGGETDPKL
jgi:hypothetical protein